MTGKTLSALRSACSYLGRFRRARSGCLRKEPLTQQRDSRRNVWTTSIPRLKGINLKVWNGVRCRFRLTERRFLATLHLRSQRRIEILAHPPIHPPTYPPTYLRMRSLLTHAMRATLLFTSPVLGCINLLRPTPNSRGHELFVTRSLGSSNQRINGTDPSSCDHVCNIGMRTKSIGAGGAVTHLSPLATVLHAKTQTHISPRTGIVSMYPSRHSHIMYPYLLSSVCSGRQSGLYVDHRASMWSDMRTEAPWVRCRRA